MVSRTASMRERLAGLDLDEALELGVPHRLAVRPQPHLPHDAAEQLVGHLARRPRARTTPGAASGHDARRRSGQGVI